MIDCMVAPKLLRIAQAMVRLALLQGYAPFAPHLVYPQALSDDNPAFRAIGLKAGLEWITYCDEIWVWGDAAISEGMAGEIAEALRSGIEQRTITAYEVEG